MKKSQRDQIYKLDEFEDLTLYADESFDTQDVDLFEFTGEDNSPLTRLKSIILSLDWEITDDILQELEDEVNNLQAHWFGDKIAEVYLQGLNKIGSYLRSKGAYAHPNSIKLLLTFFSNFEKIVSSQTITGEEITLLLKGDVRKFKILQYQINQAEGTVSPGPEAGQPAETLAPLSQEEETPSAEDNAIKLLKAAILSLDWEVTDDSLKHFTTHLSACHGQLADNKPALVIVQGLQALGEYIAEERAEAHPEAFTLLHSYNDALEQLTGAKGELLSQQQAEEILVDRINRLNHLKMLVAGISPTPIDEKLINGVVDELSAPESETAEIPSAPVAVATPAPSPTNDFSFDLGGTPAEDDLFSQSLGSEIDSLFAMESKPAMETADTQYPDEILSPDAIQPVDDELADDLIEASLNLKRGIMPALSGVEDTGGFDEDAVPLDLPAQSDLAEQLDILFAEAAGENEKEEVELLGPPDPRSLQEDEADRVVMALADAEEPLDEERPGDQPSLPDTVSQDIENTLDSFFADAEEEASPPAAPAEERSVEEIEQTLFFSEENGLEPALADSEEDKGFSEAETLAALESSPVREIEAKLDFFFGDEAMAEEEVAASLPATPPSGADEPAALADEEESLSLLFGLEEEAIDVAPALADFSLPDETEDEPDPAPALEGSEQPTRELEAQLDFFFDASEDDEEEPARATAEELTFALEAATLDQDTDEGQTGPVAALAGTGQMAPEESRQMHLATLGALLPGMVRSAAAEGAVASQPPISALLELDLPAEQRALIQLLQTVLGQLPSAPQTIAAETERVVNYLYQHLIEKTCAPHVLPKAVDLFCRWHQQVRATVPAPASVVAAMAKGDAYTARELYAELTELKAGIREEFARLRQEMGQKG